MIVKANLVVVEVIKDKVAFRPLHNEPGLFGINSFVQDEEVKNMNLEKGDVVIVEVGEGEREGVFVRQVYSVFEEGFYTQKPQAGKGWVERFLYQDTGFVALRGVKPALDALFEVGDVVDISIRRI